jgi:hypothetical protein
MPKWIIDIQIKRWNKSISIKIITLKTIIKFSKNSKLLKKNKIISIKYIKKRWYSLIIKK